MYNFYSHGKLLLTSEYAVLRGAKALAIPCKKGQKLQFVPKLSQKLTWKSFNWKNQIWFEVYFELPKLKIVKTSNENIAKRLQKILTIAKKTNPFFLLKGGDVKTYLEFDLYWGLGSSSTLIVNIASWAEINPYSLLSGSFGGSGYDIACGLSNSPIFFTRNKESPKIEPLSYSPPFINQLFFIYLNKKSNSKNAVEYFNNIKLKESDINKLSQLTDDIATCCTLKDFDNLINQHEGKIGELIKQEPIKKKKFSDFLGEVKSLGAWGGDFILATGNKIDVFNYFKKKDFNTIIPFKEMCMLGPKNNI